MRALVINESVSEPDDKQEGSKQHITCMDAGGPFGRSIHETMPCTPSSTPAGLHADTCWRA